MRIARLILVGLALLIAPGVPANADALTSGLAAYRRGDYVVAARLLGPLAERGLPDAQAAMGFMYQYGKGVPQNVYVAAQWYERAAEQANTSAQYQLGLMYDKGQGVPRSSVVAYMWLSLAAGHAGRAEREYYTRIRDATAFKLNAAQKEQAQALAYNWTLRRTP